MARINAESGKLDFVRQVMEKDPTANETLVNQAWSEGGNEGRISRSSVGKVRAQMGLTARRGPKRRAAKKGAGVATAPSESQGRGPSENAVARRPRRTSTASGRAGSADRSSALAELEGEVDHLLFRVMAVGDLPEVEDSLRSCRRALIFASRP